MPDPVRQELARPIIHHRTQDYQKILTEVRTRLKWLFQTSQEVAILACSGTGAMEAAVVNSLSPGDRVLVVQAGRFGERWAEICGVFGIKVDAIHVEWGQAADPDRLEERLQRRPYAALFVQGCETSTGVYHPIEGIARVVRQHGDTLLVIDAISALGVHDLRCDEWGIDILLTSSQKALMLPPGLALVSASERARQAFARSTMPKYYFNLTRELEQVSLNNSAFTPAISLVVGLRKVLGMLREEGLASVFARHARVASGIRAGCEALGLEIFSAAAPSNGVTAVTSPPGIPSDQLIREMREQNGIILANGQGPLRNKIFRIGHMGDVDEAYADRLIGALELGLRRLGYHVALGEAVAAASEVMEQSRDREGKKG